MLFGSAITALAFTFDMPVVVAVVVVVAAAVVVAFPSSEGFRTVFDHSFPSALFFFFFFEVEISSRHTNSNLRPGSVHSGSASCDRMFPVKLRVSSCPDRLPHYARTAA